MALGARVEADNVEADNVEVGSQGSQGPEGEGDSHRVGSVGVDSSHSLVVGIACMDHSMDQLHLAAGMPDSHKHHGHRSGSGLRRGRPQGWAAEGVRTMERVVLETPLQDCGFDTP